VGRERRSVYRFRHHLFQKYLYDELDRIERARWHAAVAASLERQAAAATAGEDLAERERLGARLAWHYESAGLPVQAARSLLDAGRQATRVSAFREALNLFDHGLALLHAVDAARPAESASAECASALQTPAERAQIEQLLQLARLVPQRSLSGSAATEVDGTLAQAIETGMGDLQERTKLAALAAEADHLIARGQFQEVLDMAQRMLDLATRCGDEAFEALAHFWFGFIYHFLGEPQRADGYFEWILARHTPGRWAELRALVGFDLLPHSLTISAINKLSLGYPDEALARSARAVTTAQDLGDHAGLAFASAIGSMTLFLLRSDPRALQERSELCCRHCEKHGFAWWQYYAAAFLGWLVVVGGEPANGIARMHSAMAAWQATGMLLGSDSLGIVLADAYLETVRRSPEGKDPLGEAGVAGLLTEGLTRIDAVLVPNSLCGQCYQAELYRIRGELLLARDGLAAAGESLACFERAMEGGREKAALAWELRAAMSIVRLRQRQGQGHAKELVEARSCLRDVYGRFTEGFTFPDPLDAAVLIGGHPRQEFSNSG
jgi:tetratricopeptide (TPR) repeat protein